MDIKIPISNDDGDYIPNKLGEKISLPEKVEDRDFEELLTGNTKNRIFELMVNYILHDLAQNPNNDMKKARNSMREITFNNNFVEKDTDNYKFSTIVWKNRLEKLHNKIGNAILYEEDGNNSLLKKERVFVDDEEREQRKQRFILQGSNNAFYLKNKMNLASHGNKNIAELEGKTINEIMKDKDSLVGYYYDRGAYMSGKEGPMRETEPQQEELESMQTELMNSFMLEDAMIDEGILKQEGVITVTKQGEGVMVVEINSYEYWSRVFQRHGFGALKPLQTKRKTVLRENTPIGEWKDDKDSKFGGEFVITGHERKKFMAHQTQKVDDPESGFYRVHYLQRQPKRKKAKGWTKEKPKWAETTKEWEKRYRGPSKQDFSIDDPNAKSLTLVGGTIQEDGMSKKVINASGLLAQKPQYAMPTDIADIDTNSGPADFTEVIDLIEYLKSLKEPSVFKSNFIENIIQLKSETANMGSRDESGYVLSRPEYWYEIKEFLVPKDQKLVLGILRLEYQLDYSVTRGSVTYDLLENLTFLNLFREGTASSTTADKQIRDKQQEKRGKEKIIELLKEITTNETEVNFNKPSPKFYEHIIEENLVDEDSPSEIEERLEEGGDYEFTQYEDNQYGSDDDAESIEEGEQVTEINPLELQGDYKNKPSELETIIDEGKEQTTFEDETTARLVDRKVAKDEYLEDSEFKTYIQEYTDDTSEQLNRKIRILKQRFWNQHKALLSDTNDSFEKTSNITPIRINRKVHQELAIIEASPSGKLQNDLADSRFSRQSTESKGKISLAQKNQTLILTLSRAFNTLGRIIGFIGDKKGG